MPGDSGATAVNTRVHVLLLPLRTRGCRRIGRPAFPTPSDVSGAKNSKQTSRATRGEIAKLYLRTSGCLKRESVGRAKALLRRAHHLCFNMRWWVRGVCHPSESCVPGGGHGAGALSPTYAATWGRKRRSDHP